MFIYVKKFPIWKSKQSRQACTKCILRDERPDTALSYIQALSGKLMNFRSINVSFCVLTTLIHCLTFNIKKITALLSHFFFPIQKQTNKKQTNKQKTQHPNLLLLHIGKKYQEKAFQVWSCSYWYVNCNTQGKQNVLWSFPYTTVTCILNAWL